MIYYYIAFRESESQGPVICYGSGPDVMPQVSPVGSFEVFEDPAIWQSRLGQLGFEVHVPVVEEPMAVLSDLVVEEPKAEDPMEAPIPEDPALTPVDVPAPEETPTV